MSGREGIGSASPHARFHGSMAYDPQDEPDVIATSPAHVVFDTVDARAGALLDHPPGWYPLSPSGLEGNPISGPVRIEGCVPGDALLVGVESIRCGPKGWFGAHAHLGWLADRDDIDPIGRTCEVTADGVRVADGLTLPLRPMIGCIGTAPVERSPAAGAGSHGGNLDHPVVGAGAEVLLPVLVDGALLSIGDVHALQGHGELSGVALEVPATVTVRIERRPRVSIGWPWVRRDARIGVLVTAGTFEEAVSIATGQMVRRLEADAGTTPAQALALLSLCGDISLGGAWGGPSVTVLLDAPDRFGLLRGAFAAKGPA